MPRRSGSRASPNCSGTDRPMACGSPMSFGSGRSTRAFAKARFPSSGNTPYAGGRTGTSVGTAQPRFCAPPRSPASITSSRPASTSCSPSRSDALSASTRVAGSGGGWFPDLRVDRPTQLPRRTTLGPSRRPLHLARRVSPAPTLGRTCRRHRNRVEVHRASTSGVGSGLVEREPPGLISTGGSCEHLTAPSI